VSLYEETEEEANNTFTIIEGDDHYARFYRHLKSKFPRLTPNDYKKSLKNVDIIFRTDMEIDLFFFELCKYIESEVKQMSDESKHLVIDFEHYHERKDYEVELYAATDIVAYVKWNLGGKERYIEVYRRTIAEELAVAYSREEFNKLIDEIVQSIAAETSATVKSLKTCAP